MATKKNSYKQRHIWYWIRSAQVTELCESDNEIAEENNEIDLSDSKDDIFVMYVVAGQLWVFFQTQSDMDIA